MSLPFFTETKVNCENCSACCQRDIIGLVKEDNPKDYPEAQQIPEESVLYKAIITKVPQFSGWLIPRHGNHCIYLVEGKCGIYHKRPAMCKAFSCVLLVEKIMANTTRKERRLNLQIDPSIWKAGVQRIHAKRQGR